MLNKLNTKIVTLTDLYKKDGLADFIKNVYTLALSKIEYRANLAWQNFTIRKLYKKFGSQIFVKKIQGSMMLLDLKDEGISRELFFKGVHEYNSTDQIQKEIKPGMTIIEVGANIGYYSLIEAKIIGKTGIIYAFEPNPINKKILDINIQLNNITKNIKTFPFGVGGKNEVKDFFLTSIGNISSFIERNEVFIKPVDTIKVKIVRLDDFFDKDIKIDYFRMDVEGFEWEVIKGMHRILSSDNGPKGCFIEVHSSLLNQSGHSAKAFLNELYTFGYDVKIARFRGQSKHVVRSTNEMLSHELLETGYWEAFFEKSR